MLRTLAPRTLAGWLASSLAANLLIGMALVRVASADVEVYRRTDASGVERYVLKRIPERAPRAAPEAEDPVRPANVRAGVSDRAPGSSPATSEGDPGSALVPGDRVSGAAPAPVDASPTNETAVVPGSKEDIRQQIERDREALRQILSSEGSRALENRSSERLREIAERLPRLQAELDALENDSTP